MSRTLNWGIIGPGRIARKFAHDLAHVPNAKLYAVASHSLERAHSFAREFGATKVYDSYEAIAADHDVDIIYIATLHTGHFRDSLLCLSHGKHVLCEKPVAMNQRQFEVMVTLAKEKNVFFMEALWTRFVPSFIKCMELLESGAIGELKMINADFCINPPYSQESRLFNPQMGGGSLLDIGIYPVFFALEAAGAPQSITAQAALDANNIDTACSVLMQHPQNILSISTSASRANGRIEAELQGSKGILRLNKCWHVPTTLDLILDGKKPVQYSFDVPGMGYQFEAAEVMHCIEQGLCQSPHWSWEKSRRLISTLDTIRSLTGIRYPEEVEAV